MEVYDTTPEPAELEDVEHIEDLPDSPWVRVLDEDRVVCEVWARDILRRFALLPNQFEGLVCLLYPHHLGIFAQVAGGQGGGLGFIDLQNCDWDFSTDEFTLDHTLWIEEYHTFVGLEDFSHFKGRHKNLFFIQPNNGTWKELTLYRKDGYPDLPDIRPEHHEFIRKLDDEEAKSFSSAMVFFEEDKRLEVYLDDPVDPDADGYWELDMDTVMSYLFG